VSFAKLRRHLPEFRPAWTLERGVRQLLAAFQAVGLTAQDFSSRKYTRLKQLQYLLEAQLLDGSLRWRLEGRRM
jgi:hypothetical protein